MADISHTFTSESLLSWEEDYEMILLNVDQMSIKLVVCTQNIM